MVLGFFQNLFRGPDLLILLVIVALIVWCRLRENRPPDGD
jgi:hypothetical protein